ncbi:MAG: hypothetical protein Q4C54_03935 [Clostridia bacterium]|nr:hypothetical protein [Clostridia bacterium]
MKNKLHFTAHLDRPVCVTRLEGALFTGDSMAHTIAVTCLREGVPVLPSGRAGAYFLRADGVTVPLTGEIAGREILVTLPESCCRVPGRFLLAIRLTEAEETLTVFAMEGHVRSGKTDVMADPESIIPSLDSLLAQIERMEQAEGEVQSAMTSLRQLTGQVLSAEDAALAAAQEATDAARTALEAAARVPEAGQVASVNGRTGDVTLTAEDVDAVPMP